MPEPLAVLVGEGPAPGINSVITAATIRACLEDVVISPLRLNVSQLITIGRDDTAFSAMKVEQRADRRIRVVHVPKTIDNDLDLPASVDTFGFCACSVPGTPCLTTGFMLSTL